MKATLTPQQTHTAGDVVLEASGLAINGPRGALVEPLDLTLRAGQTLVVVGESGSGKTLTARALTGLLPSGVTATGALETGGRRFDLSTGEVASLRGGGITLLLQDPFTSLSPTHRCGEQIAWALRGDRTSARRRALELLAEVGLGAEIARKRPFELSGGMRQRVALAAALAADPAVLIADEPTTALDVTTQREVLDLIDSLLAQRNMALMLITHDLAVARDRADEALVLRHGEVVERGPAGRVLFAPEADYTRSLLAADPGVEAAEAVAALRADPAAASAGAGDGAVGHGGSELGDAAAIADAGAGTGAGSDERQEAQPLLVATGLVRRFHGTQRPALDGVDLSIARGQTLAVVGESGSGKTTLARCLVGLEKPDAGSIEFRGKATGPRRVQIVFQDPYSALNPALSIGAGLREALTAGGGGRSVEELLGLVGLPAEYVQRRPVQLSGGERQRVAIARALAVEPELLILDESVSALDVSVQAQILQLLSQLQERLGLTMLFITHDLAVARRTSSQVLVLRLGKVVEHGPTERVLASPSDDYTKALLASIPGHGTAGHTPALAATHTAANAAPEATTKGRNHAG